MERAWVETMLIYFFQSFLLLKKKSLYMEVMLLMTRECVTCENCGGNIGEQEKNLSLAIIIDIVMIPVMLPFLRQMEVETNGDKSL